MLTHRNIYLHAVHVCLGFHIESGAVELLHTIPLFHANGWGCGTFPHLTWRQACDDSALTQETTEVFVLIERKAFIPQPRPHHGHCVGVNWPERPKYT